MFWRKNDVQKENNWLHDKVKHIDLGGLEDYSELDFLKPLLHNKKIVLLGENGHGVREHTEIKIKLIKYLYHELNFRVLAFESSLGDCSFTSKHQMDVNAAELMKQSLFKVWHTEEMAEFFTWIKGTHSYNSPLIFTGIDIQPSFQESIMSKELISIFSCVGENYGKQVEELEKEMLYQYIHSRSSTVNKKERKAKYKELQKSYKQLLLLLKQNHTHLQKSFNQKTLLLIERVLKNRERLIEMMASNFMKALKIRNKIMADNIVWLSEEMFKEEKIIIWAHNNHIAKRMQGLIGFKSTFSYVPSYLKQSSYSIGMFMYSGCAAENTRNVYEVLRPEQDSIEFRMQKTGHNISFLDISGQKKVPENAWLFNYTYTMNEGKDLSLIRPSVCYDGLITCSKANAPKYLDV
ncbi:hypothetical protein B4083_2267 [Bacillus cereus]|nr:hypothetical protein B4083_2267 [Bacillus cereus]